VYDVTDPPPSLSPPSAQIRQYLSILIDLSIPSSVISPSPTTPPSPAPHTPPRPHTQPTSPLGSFLSIPSASTCSAPFLPLFLFPFLARVSVDVGGGGAGRGAVPPRGPGCAYHAYPDLGNRGRIPILALDLSLPSPVPVLVPVPGGATGVMRYCWWCAVPCLHAI
jgi:hypothetical protein